MRKIVLASTRINEDKKEVIISILAHKSATYSAIKAYANKHWKKSGEIFRYWLSLNEPAFLAHGITKTYPYLQEGYHIYECKYTA